MKRHSDQSELTEKRYVVRLAILANAHDQPSAVQEALDRLLRAGLEQFTHSVDDVGRGAKFFVTPAEHREFLAALDHAWGEKDRQDAPRERDIA